MYKFKKPLSRIKNIRRTKDPKRALQKAAAMLEAEPERWIKGAWVRNAEGESFDAEEYFDSSCDIGGVCKVCLEGAVLIYAKDSDTYHKALGLVEKELRWRGRAAAPYQFNDNLGVQTGPEKVVEVLKAAAA